jgi:hypothetical protein
MLLTGGALTATGVIINLINHTHNMLLKVPRIKLWVMI